ncbi:MAG: hypothetical protein Q7S68_01595 [Deltaproteobacteria bacterium]|nr:hypothetical protein [Deltaproteobacteria bacterium]
MNKAFQRIIVVDRSRLAHNIFDSLFKPLGFTLLHFNTLQSLKENFSSSVDCHLLLGDSNVFGNHLENHLAWLESEKNMATLPKLFLCESGEKKIHSALRKIAKTEIIEKPFYPEDLLKRVKELCR